MKELTSISSLVTEIDYLKNRSELLDYILEHWNIDEMTFIIPENYGRTNISDKIKNQIPKSPRHDINNKIEKLLPYSESEFLVNWNELNKTLL